jgi:hypothetical protein
MIFVPNSRTRSYFIEVKRIVWLVFVLFWIALPIEAQSVTKHCKSDITFEIFKRKHVAPLGRSLVSVYLHVDENDFSAASLEKIFTKFWVEESVPLLMIVVITDKENLERKIKFDEHPLIPTLGKTDEGRKLIEEKYSNVLPTGSEYFYAQFFTDGETATYFYTPNKDKWEFVEVSFDIRSKENDVCS